MLGMGYSGMIGLINKTMANVIGFGFFASMYGYIYKHFCQKYNFNSMLLFYCFLILCMYGVFYQMEPIKQNVGYNILDLFLNVS